MNSLQNLPFYSLGLSLLSLKNPVGGSTEHTAEKFASIYPPNQTPNIKYLQPMPEQNIIWFRGVKYNLT